MTDEAKETEQASTLTWEDCATILYVHRWWLLLSPFVIWAMFFSITWLLPAKYRSETVILVEQQKVPEHYVISNVAADIQERLQSMTQQILSRTRLQSIIENFHLYQEQHKGSVSEDLVERMRHDINIDLVKAPVRPEELTAFKINFSYGDPHVAQQVTNQLTTLFIDENLRARQQESESTTGFLANQLEQAGKELAAQEQRIREFKDHYLGQLPSQLQSNLQILSGIQGRLEAETEALDHTKQQNLYLESLLGQYKSVRAALKEGKSGDINLPPTLDQELSRLKTQLADLQAHYTERHPDVRHLKQQIAETEGLKKKIDDELKAPSEKQQQSEDAAASTAPINPEDLRAMSPMMEIESQLKANKLETQNRQQEIERLKGGIIQYQAQLNQTPVREQQLADLTRNYDQSRSNYESLLAKKNQSELATNLEKRQQGEQFRILDAPNLPAKPYSPDRFRLSLFGLVVGFIVGIGSTAALEALGGRIRNAKELKALVPTTKIVEIPTLDTPQETQKRQRNTRLEWVTAAMLVSFVVLGNVFVYYRG
jgi:polysaccharide biosynthesis transport protein